MSSTTGKGKKPNDDYPTPKEHVKALVDRLVLRPDDTFLEPCKGAGAIFDEIDLPMDQKYWCELKEGTDYLSDVEAVPEFDVIITNPPFTLAEEFLRRSFRELKPGGTIAYLQRVNWLGSIKRIDFWAELTMPQKTPVLVPRPRFEGGGSDSCEYCWFIWDYGNRFPSIPAGSSLLPAWTLIKDMEHLA